jgi:hypothetical protein
MEFFKRTRKVVLPGRGDGSRSGNLGFPRVVGSNGMCPTNAGAHAKFLDLISRLKQSAFNGPSA